MVEAGFGWLLDMGVPRSPHSLLDILHAEQFSRTPGPVGLQQAIALGRALVTGNQEFRGPWGLNLDHPGLVVFDEVPTDCLEVERNLAHLQFRLEQYGPEISLAGNRYVLKTDRAILLVMPDGMEQDLEPWKQVRVQPLRQVTTA
jgi:hypothetical protein